VTQLDSLTFSYPEVGATRSLDPGSLDDRYLVFDQTWEVGSGRRDFEAASECLMTLDMQRAAGLEVAMAPDLVEEGSTFRLGIGIGRLRLDAPCRVVYTLDDTPDSSGFAYGTLDGHPESGEVRFEVGLEDENGSVHLRIASFSRPSSRLARLGGPVTRLMQRKVNMRYLSAIEAAIAPEEAESLDRAFAVRRVVFGTLLTMMFAWFLVWDLARLAGHPVALAIGAVLTLLALPAALWARIVPTTVGELQRGRTGPRPTLKDWLLAAAWVVLLLTLIYNVPNTLRALALPVGSVCLVIGIRMASRGIKALRIGRG
jgi:uncharacterized protein (UPF0548 family)